MQKEDKAMCERTKKIKELKTQIIAQLSKCQGYDGLTRLEINELIKEWVQHERDSSNKERFQA